MLQFSHWPSEPFAHWEHSQSGKGSPPGPRDRMMPFATESSWPKERGHSCSKNSRLPSIEVLIFTPRSLVMAQQAKPSACGRETHPAKLWLRPFARLSTHRILNHQTSIT